MGREAPEIRLIRETLEGVLHPSTASTVFFEALQDAGGTLPTEHRDVLALVRGPLKTRLTERVGQADASAMLGQLEAMLATIAPERAPRKRPSRHDEQTRNLVISDEVLPIFVLSSGRELSEQLKAALGPAVMSAVPAEDQGQLETRLSQIAPAMVLIDAANFPAIEPEILVDLLAPLSPDVVKALWGADLPYGQGVMEAAQRRGVGVTPFDRAEGAAPIIDVIRSRRA